MKVQMGIRAVALLAAFTALVGMTSSAMATPITWTLDNVAFNDGGLATGTFTTDNGAITGWNISTSGGTNLPALTYNTLDSDAYGPLPDVHFITLDNHRYLRLHFAGDLTDSGTDPLLTTPIFTSYECGNSPGCTIIREATAGDAENVPEPAAMAVFGVGLLGLWFVRRPRYQGVVRA